MKNEEKRVNEKYYSVVAECINEFHKYFEDIDLSNIDGLEVREITDENNSSTIKYDIASNTILINKNKIDENKNLKNSMMTELIKVISTNKDTKVYGLLSKDEADNIVLNGINDGITEMISKTIIPKENQNDISSVSILTNLISKIVSIDVIINSYFNNDSNLLIAKLEEKLGSATIVKTILNGITTESINENNNYEDKSMLGELEYVTMSRYLNNNQVSKEELEDFDRILITDSNLIDERNKDNFSSVNDVRLLIENAKERLELQNMVNKEEHDIKNEVGGKHQ